MKFTINKRTGIRKAYKNEGDEKAVAVFGLVRDLLAADLLEYAEEGTEDRVLVVFAPDWTMYECVSIDEAKAYIKDVCED